MVLCLQCMWLERKKWYDEKHDIYVKELVIENIILLYDTKYEKDIFYKLSFKWLEPYQIYNVIKDKGKYMFE